MREAPTNWTALMRGEHRVETRVDIAGTSYYGYDGESGIWELITNPALFDKLSAGNCCSAQITLTLVKPQEIPRMARIEIYVRLTNDVLTTEWVRKGVFFIDTREWDAHHDFLTITGFDAMMMAEQPYFSTGDVGSWPKTDAETVDEICDKIGVYLDDRSVLDKGYMIQLPTVVSDGSGDSVREVLGWIGGMYGGNWCITDEGKLRLVSLIPDEQEDCLLAAEDGRNILFGNTRIKIDGRAGGVDSGAQDMSISPAFEPIGRIRLVVSEDAEYTAGNEGRVIEIQCPWGTQAMANNLLTTLGGYVYQPLNATTAVKADPLWELGDVVYAGEYSMQIIEQNNNFSYAYTADLSAPGGEDIDHEYPYVDKSKREIQREIAKTSASLRVDIDQIEAQVTDEEGNYTVLTLGADGLIHLGNQSGTVTIDGDSITAGTITSDNIAASGINADRLNLTGEITFGDLDDNTQEIIEDASYDAASAKTAVGRWTYGGTTRIDGSMIQTGTVTASVLQGGTIEVLGSNGITYGEMYAGTNRAGTTAFELYGSNGLRLTTNSGLYLAGNGHSITFASSYINCASDFVPNSNNVYDLGSSSFKWSDVYATNGTIQTSDRQVKTNIVYMPEPYSMLFDKLQPVSYKFVDGHRTHIGFIAQDVEEAITECGLTSEDFAGFVKTHDEEGNTVYALRYTEFIAMNTMEIKKLKAENEELKSRLDRLEALINA